VVERGFLPGSFGVTFLAVRAFLSFVLVVLLVTAVAIDRGVFIAVIGVTFFTGDFPVHPAKRVSRLAVVEADLFPLVVGMAIRAGLPRLPFMLIVFLVAGITG
jgi:hypothetical protein